MALLTYIRQGIKSKCEGEIVVKKKTSPWHLLIYPPKKQCLLHITTLQNECCRDTFVFFIANYNLRYRKVITKRKTSPLACSCKAVCRELPMAKPYKDVSL